MDLKEKQKLLEKMKEENKKKFGSDMLIKASEIKETEFLQTGIPSIDMALGGGWAKGRLGSVYGELSSGKTTLLLQTIGKLFRDDENAMALYVDQESALDKDYAKHLIGSQNFDRLIIVEADEAEKNLDVLRESIRQGIFDFIVLDSTNALAPQTELSKDVSSTASIGVVAKLLSVWTRQVLGPLHKTNSCLVCIEQTREKIGVMVMPGMPTPVTIGCGKAVGFYCSQRLELKKTKVESQGSGDNEVAISTGVKFKVVKNKVAKPFVKGETSIKFGEGFDVVEDEKLFIIKSGIVERLNNVKWSYTCNDGTVIEIKGKDNIILTLKENNVYEEALENAKKKVFENADIESKNGVVSEYGVDLDKEQNLESESFDAE